MSEQAGRFAWVAKLSRLATATSLLILGVVIIVTVAGGVDVLLNLASFADKWQVAQCQWVIPVVSALALVLEFTVALRLLMFHGLVRMVLNNEEDVHSASSRLRPIETLLEDMAASQKKVADLASLSDQAKSLIYRDREIEALRETIQADLVKQDYSSAEKLIETMENRFGYADEAVRLRQDVQANKKATLEEKIDAALNRIQELFNRHDWPRALREVQRMIQRFPTNPKVAQLPKRLEEARNKHKRGLLQEYGEAVRKNDVDRSIEVLKELDRYLTPQEAAALAESARGVFRAKLHNLGVQFAISVTDQQWSAALATGQQIINEFPNTRIAQEVREKIDLLRVRAAAAAPTK